MYYKQMKDLSAHLANEISKLHQQISLYPDFTLLHRKTNQRKYWEHFGMMDDPVYSKKAYAKINLYLSNGFIPYDHLILTFETKDTPLSSSHVLDLIAKFL